MPDLDPAEGRRLLAEALDIGWPAEMPTTEALHKWLRANADALLDAYDAGAELAEAVDEIGSVCAEARGLHGEDCGCGWCCTGRNLGDAQARWRDATGGGE